VSLAVSSGETVPGVAAGALEALASLETQRGFHMDRKKLGASGLAAGYAFATLGMVSQLELTVPQTEALTRHAKSMQAAAASLLPAEVTAIALLLEAVPSLSKGLGSSVALSLEARQKLGEALLEHQRSIDLVAIAGVARGLRVLSTGEDRLLCVTLESPLMSTHFSGEQGHVVVAVTDPLGASMGGYTVTARKVVGTKSEAPLVEDEAFKPVPCAPSEAEACHPTRFRLNLMSQPRERDVYSLLLTVEKDDQDALEPIEVERNLKLTVAASVRDMNVAVSPQTEWHLVNGTKIPFPVSPHVFL
jgi:hypothetical protein